MESLSWIEDLLPQDILRKRMFGGFAYYFHEKLVLLLFESEGSRSYKGQKFDFELWQGCMFPAEKDKHAEILGMYPFLMEHPILPKWLYLPMETENFENNVPLLLREIRRQSELFGTIPKAKGSSKKAGGAKKKSRTAEDDEVLDTRRPAMFSDEPGMKTVEKAKMISDLKNLGPETEKHFLKAGITTAPQLVKMGWKKGMEKLVAANPKTNHSIYAYAVIGALENKVWNLISEDLKKEARDWMKVLRDRQKERGPKATPARSKVASVKKKVLSKSARSSKKKSVAKKRKK